MHPDEIQPAEKQLEQRIKSASNLVAQLRGNLEEGHRAVDRISGAVPETSGRSADQRPVEDCLLSRFDDTLAELGIASNEAHELIDRLNELA